MGRLAGYRYKEVVRKLRACGFAFDRQAAGSHEIWFNPTSNRYTTAPTTPAKCRKVRFGQSRSKWESTPSTSCVPDTRSI